MFNNNFWRVAVCVFVVSMPSSLWASQARVDIGAIILNIRSMEVKSLLKICKEQSNSIDCELYQEKKIDRKTNKHRTYSVFTANFQ